MQSIQVGSTMIVEIMYAKVMKNIGTTRTKGVNVKLIPHCTVCHETLSSCKFWVLHTIIEFRFFNRFRKKKKENMEIDEN